MPLLVALPAKQIFSSAPDFLTKFMLYFLIIRHHLQNFVLFKMEIETEQFILIDLSSLKIARIIYHPGTVAFHYIIMQRYLNAKQNLI
jgi:hypothetical protein